MEINQNKAPENGGPKTNEEWLWQGRIEYGEHVRQSVKNKLAEWRIASASAAVFVGDEMIKQVVQPMLAEMVEKALTVIFDEAAKSSDRFFGLERISTIVIDGRGSGGEVKINKDVARAASQKIIFMNSSRSANGGVK